MNQHETNKLQYRINLYTNVCSNDDHDQLSTRWIVIDDDIVIGEWVDAKDDWLTDKNSIAFDTILLDVMVNDLFGHGIKISCNNYLDTIYLDLVEDDKPFCEIDLRIIHRE